MKIDFCAKYEGGQFQFHSVVGIVCALTPRDLNKDGEDYPTHALIIASDCPVLAPVVLRGANHFREVRSPFIVSREILSREYPHLNRKIAQLSNCTIEDVVVLPLPEEERRLGPTALLSDIVSSFRGVPFDTTRPDDEVQNLVAFVQINTEGRRRWVDANTAQPASSEVLEGEEV